MLKLVQISFLQSRQKSTSHKEFFLYFEFIKIHNYMHFFSQIQKVPILNPRKRK